MIICLNTQQRLPRYARNDVALASSLQCAETYPRLCEAQRDAATSNQQPDRRANARDDVALVSSLQCAKTYPRHCEERSDAAIPTQQPSRRANPRDDVALVSSLQCAKTYPRHCEHSAATSHLPPKLSRHCEAQRAAAISISLLRKTPCVA